MVSVVTGSAMMSEIRARTIAEALETFHREMTESFRVFREGMKEEIKGIKDFYAQRRLSHLRALPDPSSPPITPVVESEDVEDEPLSDLKLSGPIDSSHPGIGVDVIQLSDPSDNVILKVAEAEVTSTILSVNSSSALELSAAETDKDSKFIVDDVARPSAKPPDVSLEMSKWQSCCEDFFSVKSYYVGLNLMRIGNLGFIWEAGFESVSDRGVLFHPSLLVDFAFKRPPAKPPNYFSDAYTVLNLTRIVLQPKNLFGFMSGADRKWKIGMYSVILFPGVLPAATDQCPQGRAAVAVSTAMFGTEIEEGTVKGSRRYGCPDDKDFRVLILAPKVDSIIRVMCLLNPDGDVLSCVPTHLQPAFDHPWLKGHQRTLEWPRGETSVEEFLVSSQNWSESGGTGSHRVNQGVEIFYKRLGKKLMLDHLESVLSNESISLNSGQFIVEVKPQGVSKGLVIEKIVTSMDAKNERSKFVMCNDNLENEFVMTSVIVDEYPCLAMDTGFPGIVSHLNRSSGRSPLTAKIIKAYMVQKLGIPEKANALSFLLYKHDRKTLAGPNAMSFHPYGRTLFCGLAASFKVYSWELIIRHVVEFAAKITTADEFFKGILATYSAATYPNTFDARKLHDLEFINIFMDVGKTNTQVMLGVCNPETRVGEKLLSFVLVGKRTSLQKVKFSSTLAVAEMCGQPIISKELPCVHNQTYELREINLIYTTATSRSC